MESTTVAVIHDTNVDVDDNGNNSQQISGHTIDRSQSPFLASLPWFTNAIIRPDLIPSHIADMFGVSVLGITKASC